MCHRSWPPGSGERGRGGGRSGAWLPCCSWSCWVQNVQFSDFQMEVVLLLRAFGNVWRYVGLSLLGGGACCCWMLLSVFQCIGQTPQQGIVPLKMSVVPRLRIPGRAPGVSVCVCVACSTFGKGNVHRLRTLWRTLICAPVLVLVMGTARLKQACEDPLEPTGKSVYLLLVLLNCLCFYFESLSLKNIVQHKRK